MRQLKISIPRFETIDGNEELTLTEETVQVSDDSSIEISELRPFKPDQTFQSIEEETHPFVGAFQHSFQADLIRGTNSILLETENALQIKGFASISIDIEEVGGAITTGVEVEPKDDFKDRGTFNPIFEMFARNHGGEYFEFELPPPLSTYEMVISGGTLIPATVKKIEAGKDDVHTFHLPFLVDGEPFTIDVTFSVGIETRRVGAVPATP